VINQRIGTAFHTMIGAINGLWADGVRSWPWLKPGFDEKLFADLTTNTVLMQDVIDRFNTMIRDCLRFSRCDLCRRPA
jgi:hypothetical protein